MTPGVGKLQPELVQVTTSLQAGLGSLPYSHSRPTMGHAPPPLGGEAGHTALPPPELLPEPPPELLPLELPPDPPLAPEPPELAPPPPSPPSTAFPTNVVPPQAHTVAMIPIATRL